MEKPPFHILLADDDEADRLLFAEAFSDLKIKTVVHTVNNGVELMETLHAEAGHLPHLLFLDLNMPLKNGQECLLEIRGNAALKHLFVAIYSTSDNEKDMDETFRNGANIYITKPSDFNLLKQVLEKAVMTTVHYQHKSINRENFVLRIA